MSELRLGNILSGKEALYYADQNLPTLRALGQDCQLRYSAVVSLTLEGRNHSCSGKLQ